MSSSLLQHSISKGSESLDGWSVDNFSRELVIKVAEKKVDQDNELIQSIEFDMINIDAPLVNAFRRIIISEIPTIAIEKVHVHNNTTLFQDEFLAHRLGLIPIRVDPRLLEWDKPDVEENKKSIVFQLKVKCGKGKIESSDVIRVEKNVYSKHIKWVPLPGQEEMFDPNDLPRSVHEDILIAKLSPGQELDLKLVCVKGIGQDHTKFSPVATASYRFLPEITLNRPVIKEDAVLLQKCFTEGVIEVVRNKAVVKNPRLDMCSRNIFRYEHLKDAVNMEMVDNHVIFTIESTGALPPSTLMLESINVLSKKCDRFLNEIKSMKH